MKYAIIERDGLSYVGKLSSAVYIGGDDRRPRTLKEFIYVDRIDEAHHFSTIRFAIDAIQERAINSGYTPFSIVGVEEIPNPLYEEVAL